MIKNFKSEFSELKEVVSYARQWSQDNKLDHNTQGKIIVVCDEVFSNIVEHSFPLKNNDSSETILDPLNKEDVVIELDCKSHELYKITFTYGGCKFDPSSHSSSMLKQDISSKGGMGINIIKRISASLQYSHINNTNHLSIFIK